MMDEIDFELCLDVDQVATAFYREKRKRYSIHSNITNSINNTTPRIRTHNELGDSTADESMITIVPPAKRARISQSDVPFQTESTNTSYQSTGPLLDSSQFLNHHTDFFNFKSNQGGPVNANDVLPAVPRRAMSEDMDRDMMYMGSETEAEAETESPPGRFHNQCRIHSFGTWSNPSLRGGLGSFSSRVNNSPSMFAIYEDAMDMEIEGVFCGEEWYYSPDEDKENVENGNEQGSILQEMDSNSVAVHRRG
ncbi:hypothetical protein V6Z96_000417 [Aspergillus fumigatus]|nr:hypothetical protein KXX11_005904 [Aspergillus fumigatus]KAH1529770.1 hypothetical protein KXX18_008432 [Aspergillus fumigatus]KAH1611124.1 hypothetical protein KXX44_007827 [Aspergillus fumigatus]KAH1636263.1 hypothetical protein KXX39_007436 [Aspergillus fumigatus]KAH1964897.1 hypothetical protein KXV90_007302 [Aspergillus fumigatus]